MKRHPSDGLRDPADQWPSCCPSVCPLCSLHRDHISCEPPNPHLPGAGCGDLSLSIPSLFQQETLVSGVPIGTAKPFFFLFSAEDRTGPHPC